MFALCFVNSLLKSFHASCQVTGQTTHGVFSKDAVLKQQLSSKICARFSKFVGKDSPGEWDGEVQLKQTFAIDRLINLEPPKLAHSITHVIFLNWVGQPRLFRAKMSFTS